MYMDQSSKSHLCQQRVRRLQLSQRHTHPFAPASHCPLSSQSATPVRARRRRTFSIRFDHIAFSEMLFSSGDGKRWLQMGRPPHRSATAANEPLRVAVGQSHVHRLPYETRIAWPFVRTDLRPPEADPLLYAEADRLATSPELLDEGGANVWVRPWVEWQPMPASQPEGHQHTTTSPHTDAPLRTDVPAHATPIRPRTMEVSFMRASSPCRR